MGGEAHDRNMAAVLDVRAVGRWTRLSTKLQTVSTLPSVRRHPLPRSDGASVCP